MIAFNPRVVHSVLLLVEAAIIGGFAFSEFLDRQYPAVALLLAIPLLWRVAFIGISSIASRTMFPTPEATPLFSWPWLKLVVAGGVAILRNQIWIAFPPELSHAPKVGASPIVALIPGYSYNGGGFQTLPRRLAARGLECVVFDLADPIGDLEANAADVAAWLKAIARLAPQRSIVLVGLSMGGIIARRATAHPDTPRIAHLVTISSPHAGTWSAYFAIGAAAHQLRIGSAILSGLASQELACPATAIWTPDDALILPPVSGKLAGAEIVAVSGYTHFAVVEAPAVEAAILRVAMSSLNAVPAGRNEAV